MPANYPANYVGTTSRLTSPRLRKKCKVSKGSGGPTPAAHTGLRLRLEFAEKRSLGLPTARWARQFSP